MHNLAISTLIFCGLGNISICLTKLKNSIEPKVKKTWRIRIKTICNVTALIIIKGWIEERLFKLRYIKYIIVVPILLSDPFYCTCM